MFKFSFEFDLYNASGERFMTAKAQCSFEEAQRIAATYLRLFSDVKLVHMVEKAYAGYRLDWDISLDGDVISTQRSIAYERT